MISKRRLVHTKIWWVLLAKGLKPIHLAAHLDMTARAIENWCLGKNKPNRFIQVAVGEFLKIPIAGLFDEMTKKDFDLLSKKEQGL